MTAIAITMAFALCHSLLCTGQYTTSNAGKEVLVTDWHSRGLLFVPEFFEQNRDSLIAQIGEKEFQQVLKFGNMLGWPGSIRHKLEFGKDTIARQLFYQKLSKLKMYKIASWQQYYNNTKTYRYALLRVPYAVNSHWDLDSKWDTIYFIVKESAIEEY